MCDTIDMEIYILRPPNRIFFSKKKLNVIRFVFVTCKDCIDMTRDEEEDDLCSEMNHETLARAFQFYVDFGRGVDAARLDAFVMMFMNRCELNLAAARVHKAVHEITVFKMREDASLVEDLPVIRDMIAPVLELFEDPDTVMKKTKEVEDVDGVVAFEFHTVVVTEGRGSSFYSTNVTHFRQDAFECGTKYVCICREKGDPTARPFELHPRPFQIWMVVAKSMDQIRQMRDFSRRKFQFEKMKKGDDGAAAAAIIPRRSVLSRYRPGRVTV